MKNNSPVGEIRQAEGKLLNVIEMLGSLEWRRFQQRFPLTWDDGEFQQVDHSTYPPVCSFRFVEENASLVDQLKCAVESYRGKFEWVMVSHQRNSLPGVNWMICAKRYWALRDAAADAGMDTGKYMAEREPNFGPDAYEDFVGLTEYIRAVMLPTPLLPV